MAAPVDRTFTPSPSFLLPLARAVALTAIATRHALAVAVAFSWIVSLRVLCAAPRACFEPDAAGEAMPDMTTLVRLWIYALEVLQTVVCAVVIFVMNLIAWRNWAVCSFPDQPVLGR